MVGVDHAKHFQDCTEMVVGRDRAGTGAPLSPHSAVNRVPFSQLAATVAMSHAVSITIRNKDYQAFAG